MITDQNVVLTSHGPITVRVQRGVPKYRAATALLEGDGTRERPLRFVLLACHADMADEASADVIEQNTNALAEDVRERLRTQQSNVRDVLEASNTAAAATHRYYSIVVGRLIQRNVIVSALGNVGGIVVKGCARTPIIRPNVVRVGEHTILDGSFGIGFKAEAVSAKQFDLEDDATLLLIIGEEPGAINTIAEHGMNAQAFIEGVVHAARASQPIVAAVR